MGLDCDLICFGGLFNRFILAVIVIVTITSGTKKSS
jgi:hypothetical protein